MPQYKSWTLRFMKGPGDCGSRLLPVKSGADVIIIIIIIMIIIISNNNSAALVR
jgi:hypothetical protein